MDQLDLLPQGSFPKLTGPKTVPWEQVDVPQQGQMLFQPTSLALPGLPLVGQVLPLLLLPLTKLASP